MSTVNPQNENTSKKLNGSNQRVLSEQKIVKQQGWQTRGLLCEVTQNAPFVSCVPLASVTWLTVCFIILILRQTLEEKASSASVLFLYKYNLAQQLHRSYFNSHSFILPSSNRQPASFPRPISFTFTYKGRYKGKKRLLLPKSGCCYRDSFIRTGWKEEHKNGTESFNCLLQTGFGKSLVVWSHVADVIPIGSLEL